MSFQSNYSVVYRFRHLFLAALSGLVMSFALIQPGTWLAAWIGLVPLFIAIRYLKSVQAALCGLIAGLVYYGIILHWMTLFGYAPWALLALYQALYWAAFAGLAVRLSPQRIGWRGYVAIPAAWVVVEYLRTLGAYAFVWGSFAHTQATNLPFAQIAAVTGPWGIAFALVLLNMTLADAVASNAKTRLGPLFAAGVLVLCVLGYGLNATRSAPNGEGHEQRIAILQANMKNDFNPVPDYPRISFERLSGMTRDAAAGGARLVIWPETAIPCDITSPGWADVIGRVARDASVEILAGGYDPSEDPAKQGSYNAVFLFSGDGDKAAAYRKAQLVPFGEFVPLREKLPFLKNYGIRPRDVLAGSEHSLVRTGIGKVGISICFESLFPQIARGETLDGAQILCVVTNDAWFQRTQAARQHLMMAQLRAIENRRYVARAAGTGISALIDPYGRIEHQVGLFRMGTIVADVRPRQELTFYTRHGDWLAFFCVAILIACLPLLLRGSVPHRGAEHHQGTSRASESRQRLP